MAKRNRKNKRKNNKRSHNKNQASPEKKTQEIPDPVPAQEQSPNTLIQKVQKSKGLQNGKISADTPTENLGENANFEEITENKVYKITP